MPMNVLTRYLEIKSKGESHMIDLTEEVQDSVETLRFSNGVITIFVPGSTGAVTTIEYEDGLLTDFPAMLERVAAKNIKYEHQKRWHDNNGHSHVRASLIGPSLTVPFVKGKLTLGTWQQIVFIELDIQPRSRRLVVQIMGE